ncbi:malto-oligosyltrehalose synthase [Nocardiopsis ansamitocini]|uniref:Malto-oligosyltrehalose synthase n=1 Tax=Nocardiopsis ansamitocini TaxID=1670832 RepID=A0A9W6P7I1_9ACTN|nr:malto-oligosyltrehalose synthase [Nocardiopsis ansamitocini]GLU48600.1 malto-oligosyltrehalose synthase [Nocardiopsis ansamitocini]
MSGTGPSVGHPQQWARRGADVPTPPSSTYRLQLRPEFDFAAAADTADYLRLLGTGAAYASPMLAAASGSTHGYDVVDPTRAAPALGGERARRELSARLREVGLGLVVDIVPNHMSIADPAANQWWWDVLLHGRQSRYARCFDIDWSAGPLLVPVLGDDGDDGAGALGTLTIADDCITYYEHRFPIAEGTYEPGDNPLEVLERQHYRLVSWRRGDSELNYRRFFDVTTLAAVRVEDPGVLEATHGEVLRWALDGDVQGIRVDHPDGLSDPGEYTRRLRALFPGWIVLEKILAPGETLPASWPVDGSTGYDALREVCGVFVDDTGQGRLTLLAEGLGVPTDFTEVETECRRAVATTVLAAEVARIAALVPGVEPDRARGAVAELLGAFEVYRSYLPEGEQDWARAIARSAERRPDLAGALAVVDEGVRADPGGELARRIQQTSGMVIAKGTEDTAFYRYSRFIALNEVGGSPDRFGVTVPEFHAAAAAREASWPRSMTTLSTHDTKRSEDVRARLAVLAEVPGEFAEAVRGWTGRAGLSEPTLDLLAWQTLVGAWPIDADRLRGYLEKAAKEAKLRTSWVDPDPAFEKEVAAWPDRVLGDAGLSAEVAAFVDRVRGPGWSNALGQKLVQLLMPGVPDVYQGTELWDLSLVDPDNRRLVDYDLRRGLLERLDGGWRPPVDETGAAKLHVVATALRLRRARELTGYRPLPASGPAARHCLAFARGADQGVVVVATRLPVGLAAAGGWRDTVVPLPSGKGEWTNLLTGRTVPPTSTAGFTTAPLADVLADYPVALLMRA